MVAELYKRELEIVQQFNAMQQKANQMNVELVQIRKDRAELEKEEPKKEEKGDDNAKN